MHVFILDICVLLHNGYVARCASVFFAFGVCCSVMAVVRSVLVLQSTLLMVIKFRFFILMVNKLRFYILIVGQPPFNYARNALSV
jgi:hypothetical protein